MDKILYSILSTGIDDVRLAMEMNRRDGWNEGEEDVLERVDMGRGR